MTLRQIAAGARHIDFGDPDFLNGPGHALSVVRAMHAEFPDLTFDVTTKVEHILKRGSLLPELGRLGCLLNGCCYGNVACPDCASISFPLPAFPRFAAVPLYGLLRQDDVPVGLLLFSPVNFPADRLPSALQAVHRVLPVMYMADLMRWSLTGRFAEDIGRAFLVVSLWCALGIAVSWRVVRRRD